MADHARSDDPAVQTQLDRFAQLSPGRDILGLERITALLDLLGNPHRRLPPVFHVAGTNGKGSTCAFLRAALEAAGKTVHVYTSPHLVRFNERIRVAGKLIGDEALAPLLAEVLDLAEAHDIGPSFFEATTAAAFLAFSRTPADACVIEVGLGGRLDATNVVTPVVCGIAQVGIDHQAFLGDTLAEIAGEKAGIAKQGVPLVCLAQEPDALAQIEPVAAQAGAPLLLEARDWQIDLALTPGLAGAHQIRNANLAAQMLIAQGIPETAIRTGISAATWPARFQRLPEGPLTQHGPLWIDGAHNPAAADVLAHELAAQPMHLILGILANKDADAIVAALAPHALSLTFVAVPDHESHDPVALAARWGGRAAMSLEDALSSRAGTTLIVGSLYLCGEVLRLNGTLPD
ncbi:folylpolyglutamate synthase/dihydrofolate synthase family protein [Sphingomonas sp. SUN039]|uniref:bifunctional folylpolyglutamate synthase/dihydrofolate synthase n=1 Tax=Sphingomonas sp. SUN039 TaxID=2937787 RepID=UPI002164DFF2|nr:folylpolyglutamate synthase/dihydrofolate synthase family protein [Sphingomonas sp. SUN039]UVO52922.1 bifunctional folylpolyglutamate synthase/dihydrofolate synthase [Sphingomonas sp. SUN039]